MGANMNASLETLFSKMDNFISTKTVVGEPVNIGGVILVPLIEVSFGVGAGDYQAASDKNKEKDTAGSNSNGGGGGIGARLIPSGVIVIIDGTVQLVNVKNQDSLNKLIDMVPGVVSKLNLGSLFSKKGSSKNNAAESAEAEDVKAE